MATWLHKSLYLFGTVQVRNKMKSVGPFAVAELETGTLAKRWLVEMFGELRISVSALEAKIHQIIAAKRGQEKFAKGFLQDKTIANVARLPAKVS